ARPVTVLGITPPDLVVSQATAQPAATAGGPYTFSYTVQNGGDAFNGAWTDRVWIADNPDLSRATSKWQIGEYRQQRGLGNGETYSVSQTVQLAPSIQGGWLVVETDRGAPGSAGRWDVAETDETNNARAVSSTVTNRPADLRVTAIVTQPQNFSGEDTTISWTVTNQGADVWSGTRGWVDSVYFSADPEFIPSRAVALGSVVHTNTGGLLAGASYTSTGKFRLPPGTDGPYYIYVITDSQHASDRLEPETRPAAMDEDQRGYPSSNDYLRDVYYANSAFEGLRRDNNIGQGTLNVTYREADLEIDSITVSNPNPASGDTLTVTWTATNRGTRETRVSNWLDGVFLSRDASLDNSDYPLVDRGELVEIIRRVRLTSLTDATGKPRYLQPGESYTNQATFTLPSSISGDFHLIVKADTATAKYIYTPVPSSIREGLDTLEGSGPGAVLEFQDEGDNVASISLPITLSPPPDLQVTQVTIPESVIAGQNFTVNYRVENKGGKTPSDQGNWYDFVYLSKDRFLDINKDRYLGYVSHGGGLPAAGSYDGTLNFTAPRDMEGTYYVFVVTDPARAWGSGESGRVLEFGHDDNNASTAAQPLRIETPPPADLQVTQVVVPATGQVGQEVEISYTVANQSINPAYGRWTDALYLSSDNAWDLNDTLLGKVAHVGDLAGNASYDGKLKVKLPPLKDGSWRIVVRPDLYNEVFEGRIVYTDTGLNLPPGEANNRVASGAALNVTVPALTVGAPLSTTLSTGDTQLYKVSVAAGETLRIALDSSAGDGANEVYVRYGDVPNGHSFDAAYSDPVAADQKVLIPTTQAGDYYILVHARQSASGTPVTLRADLLPLSITRVTPDQGGTGDAAHRWVTMDIEGARFAAGALVKLSRPGVFEVEPERWQVLDATHIRAVFDLRNVPHGLYDIVVTNPDGQHVTEAYRYLVERAIEDDVTIGIGGPRSINPGDAATYSVTLQSLTNVDTPYVRFDIGASDMGNSQYLLEGLSLPYVVFGSNVGGRPDGAVAPNAGNTQSYGQTPTTPVRSDVPWAALDGSVNTSGWNLAPGYAFDVSAGGSVGFTFNVQTYPGLAEWLAYDFEGLRSKLYAIRPDWKAAGLLDGGVSSLNNLSPGLAAKFLSRDPEEHITKLEALSMPFRFDTLGAATPLTRDEFIADQTRHAKQLRLAILADASAPSTLGVLAADEAQWVQGWLAALETAGLLRPVDDAPPIRSDAKVMSLNATLATGILIGKGGESYRTQADLLGFFAKVQQWYGDTARYAGDTAARHAPVDYHDIRTTEDGDIVESPVPVAPNPADYDQHAAQDTHFISFDVFAGGLSELEYLRHIGVLDERFNPVGPQALNLTQYLQQAANRGSAAQAAVSVRGPQALPAANGSTYVPADYALPYTISFNNPGEHAVGELRLVTQLDADVDPRSLRLQDLKIGDINVHVPADQAVFQSDFDFTGSKGFVLRVSAGIDAQTRVATWLIQAIDPDTGEVLHDPARGLLLPGSSGKPGRGFVSYTVRALDLATTGATLGAQARVFFDDAPPIDSASISHTLDAGAPTTALSVHASGTNASGAPTYEVSWKATDDASGIKHVTVYVAENGGDFRIWRKQVAGDTSQAVFTGEAGKTYEFLAVATDNAGNREAALVANAVLPDDGSRQDAQQALGSNETLAGTAELPAATPDRSYPSNEIFQHATLRLPGFVAPAQPGDLQSVLAPMTVRGIANGFASSDADIGALAMVELADGSVLASAGSLRNEVYRFSKDGGRSTTPLFVLDSPVLDMAVDALGQLWVMTGKELLLVDAGSGAVIERHIGPAQDPLTHALAIQPGTGLIYVSSGNGVEIFDPKANDAAKAWKHFSNTRVGDLAFGPDGRLWGVRWTGSDVPGGAPGASTEIVSFPMSGRTLGRAEVEYRLSGIVDSIAFGRAGSPLDGVLVASSNLPQRPVTSGTSAATPHNASVWMVELQSHRVLQLATGGTRGESLFTTADGRILVAQTNSIDEIAPIKAPHVLGSTITDGALVPLPLVQVAVTFDQAMWTGSSVSDATDPSSVLNVANYRLVSTGVHTDLVLQPNSVRWDAGSRSAVLTLPNLPAGGWRLEVSSDIRSAAQLRLAESFIVAFTAVTDLSNLVRLDFADTRGNRLTGEVSYDVSITNIGVDDLRGPLMLLLDPGRYFGNAVVGGTQGSGDQSDLWIIDLSSALMARSGRLASGETLARQTVTVRPADVFGTAPGTSALVKFNLGHGIYAVPYDNTPPTLAIDGAAADAAALPQAIAGQPYTATLRAQDSDGALFFWQIVQGPAGLTIEQDPLVESGPTGYGNAARLHWTPSARDRADSEVLIRVVDSRGGVALRRFTLAVDGANHVPVLGAVGDITLDEGQSLRLPLMAADADGDAVTVSLRNLPAGARFDAATGILSWTPGYDQAGDYAGIAVVASDGKHTVTERFNIRVNQGYAKPVLGVVPAQTLREGERYALQLPGRMPGGLTQADGTTITLSYSSPWLPGGATLNEENGWFAWTPGFAQAGTLRLPVTLTATYTPADGSGPVTTSVTREIELNVLNANGAPQFDPAETWNLLEGQALRISVFAFDPDNPGFEPKVRMSPTAPATGGEGSAASVSYEVTGLPPGASFDAETLELVWTPGYSQAGTYHVTVKATDNGDGTGVPLTSELVVPIVVSNANRAPQIADVSNAFVDRGATLDIPVRAVDADGNPVTLTLLGLPPFATYTQTSAAGSDVTGVIHFAPGAGHRGDYTLALVAQDNGDGDINQSLLQAKSFVVTVRSPSEAPVVSAPRRSVALVGQEIRIPIRVSDLDQDALSYAAEGLPAGARIVTEPQYGRAYIAWTPTAGQAGTHDFSLVVTDSGLPPADAGYILDPDHPPVPNTSVVDLRVVVRAANEAPALIAVSALGASIAGDALAGSVTTVTAQEGVALSLELSARDTDLDFLQWTVTGLPTGMTMEPSAGSDGQTRLVLRWTPGLFAAQSDNTEGATPGRYRLVVTAGDGMASVTREIDLAVANVNQAPSLLPMPLQLVQEGQTLAFTMLAADADNDATRLALVYDGDTPAGVNFDPNTGYFEWTPGADVVNNASGDSRTFSLRFSNTDGSTTTLRTVQVRVFDVNRAPDIATASHAAVVGQSFVLPVVKGATAAADAIRVSDADGAVQTQNLVVSFSNLPEGARYDAASGTLRWTPGPGQVGDFVVLATVSDGRNTTTQSFTLRVVAEAAGNAPKILINTTPSTPVLPGQAVLATVRATGFSPIAGVSVQVRGAGIGAADWTDAVLDGMGRLRINPSAPGLVEVRVTAIDADGFSNTQTETVRVRDPLDTTAPQLSWNGALAGTASDRAPAVITHATQIQAQIA
ncbi:MAG TPA: putative Ig domain-containing protein, partial [Burkholderiaceae bacterium]|nr:putative Ig domain-containing protein [Burkholderiaceae bacterium]